MVNGWHIKMMENSLESMQILLHYENDLII